MKHTSTGIMLLISGLLPVLLMQVSTAGDSSVAPAPNGITMLAEYRDWSVIA